MEKTGHQERKNNHQYVRFNKKNSIKQKESFFCRIHLPPPLKKGRKKPRKLIEHREKKRGCELHAIHTNIIINIHKIIAIIIKKSQ